MDINPARESSESFADFKARRAIENELITKHLKGTMSHVSKTYYWNEKGQLVARKGDTYRKNDNV
jgi:hypothetical protein